MSELCLSCVGTLFTSACARSEVGFDETEQKATERRVWKRPKHSTALVLQDGQNSSSKHAPRRSKGSQRRTQHSMIVTGNLSVANAISGANLGREDIIFPPKIVQGICHRCIGKALLQSLEHQVLSGRSIREAINSGPDAICKAALLFVLWICDAARQNAKMYEMVACLFSVSVSFITVIWAERCNLHQMALLYNNLLDEVKVGKTLRTLSKALRTTRGQVQWKKALSHVISSTLEFNTVPRSAEQQERDQSVNHHFIDALVSERQPAMGRRLICRNEQERADLRAIAVYANNCNLAEGDLNRVDPSQSRAEAVEGFQELYELVFAASRVPAFDSNRWGKILPSMNWWAQLLTVSSVGRHAVSRFQQAESSRPRCKKLGKKLNYAKACFAKADIAFTFIVLAFLLRLLERVVFVLFRVSGAVMAANNRLHGINESTGSVDATEGSHPQAANATVESSQAANDNGDACDASMVLVEPEPQEGGDAAREAGMGAVINACERAQSEIWQAYKDEGEHPSLLAGAAAFWPDQVPEEQKHARLSKLCLTALSEMEMRFCLPHGHWPYRFINSDGSGFSQKQADEFLKDKKCCSEEVDKLRAFARALPEQSDQLNRIIVARNEWVKTVRPTSLTEERWHAHQKQSANCNTSWPRQCVHHIVEAVSRCWRRKGGRDLTKLPDDVSDLWESARKGRTVYPRPNQNGSASFRFAAEKAPFVSAFGRKTCASACAFGVFVSAHVCACMCGSTCASPFCESLGVSFYAFCNRLAVSHIILMGSRAASKDFSACQRNSRSSTLSDRKD